MNETYESWKKGNITDSRMALIYFINRFAVDFDDQRLMKLIGHIPYEKILDNYQFKKIKGKAIICLKKWVSGEWDLTLCEKIFTPFEVLSFQARGIRPVTMRYNNENLPVLHRKNSLDFFVHDLEHGYMFFHDEDLKQMQKQFFTKIERSLSCGLWTEKLEDKVFKEKFYYMISDMNSHKEHYRAYLQSMLSLNEFREFEFLFDEKESSDQTNV